MENTADVKSRSEVDSCCLITIQYKSNL